MRMLGENALIGQERAGRCCEAVGANEESGMHATGITGQSSRRGMCVTPTTYQTTTARSTIESSPANPRAKAVTRIGTNRKVSGGETLEAAGTR